MKAFLKSALLLATISITLAPITQANANENDSYAYAGGTLMSLNHSIGDSHAAFGVGGGAVSFFGDTLGLGASARFAKMSERDDLVSNMQVELHMRLSNRSASPVSVYVGVGQSEMGVSGNGTALGFKFKTSGDLVLGLNVFRMSEIDATNASFDIGFSF